MADKLRIELGEVQKTLLIPLWGRAMEYESPTALVRDSYAHDIMRRLDFDFGTIATVPYPLRVNTSIRAYQFDRILKAFIASHPNATIVNLGAGLDTTFFRVDNGSIHWYDLDLEDSMHLRRQLIPEGPRNKTIARSIFDRSWFDDIRERDGGIFFMAAGVLAYLEEKEIRRLFIDLAGVFPGSELLFETYHPLILWLRNRNIRRQARHGSVITRMNWGLRNARTLTRWSPRIKVMEAFNYYEGIDMDAHWSRKDTRALRGLARMGMLGIVHLKLG